MSASREYLRGRIETMKTVVAGRYLDLVLSLDEVSSSEWEGRKPKKSIAPWSIPSDEEFHVLSRRCCHVTLLICVSAAGDAVAPIVFPNRLFAIFYGTTICIKTKMRWSDSEIRHT
jgi:hypothetical protein